MSNNTNTLFWVITGAVIVLTVFLLINNSQNNTLGRIANKFDSIFTGESVNTDTSDMAVYYGHDSNYKNLIITNESLFIFDSNNGVINGYIGNLADIVIPYQIGGVPVKRINNLQLQDKFWMYQDCMFITSLPEEEDMWVQDMLMWYSDMGIYQNGVCIEQTLLNSVVIPSSVEEIGDCAFCYNQNLSSVSLPASIKRIESSAFAGNRIETLKLDKLKKLTYIGGYAFSNNIITGEVVIPDSVTYMDNGVFESNNITKAKISKNLSEMPYYTFNNNPNMESVMFRNSNMNIRDKVGNYDYTFNRDSNFIIKVPIGSKSWYQQFPALSNYKIEEYI